MVPQDDFRGFLQEVLLRAQQDRILWRSEHAEDDPHEYYAVNLDTDTELKILASHPETEPDSIVVVLQYLGNRIAVLIAEDGDFDWELLKGIVSEASRFITKWDEGFAKAQQAIKKDGPIGL